MLCAVTIPPADLRSLSSYHYTVCGRMCMSSVIQQFFRIISTMFMISRIWNVRHLIWRSEVWIVHDLDCVTSIYQCQALKSFYVNWCLVFFMCLSPSYGIRDFHLFLVKYYSIATSLQYFDWNLGFILNEQATLRILYYNIQRPHSLSLWVLTKSVMNY